MIPIPLFELVNLYVLSETSFSQLAFTSLRKVLVNDRLSKLRRARSALKTKIGGLENEVERMNELCLTSRDVKVMYYLARARVAARLSGSPSGVAGDGDGAGGGLIDQDLLDEMDWYEERFDRMAANARVRMAEAEKSIEDARELSAICEMEIERLERRRWERWNNFWNEF